MPLRALAGGRVFAEVSGSGGPLVVLLHGWGRDRSDLRGVAVGLAGTVAALDLPGSGSSPPPPAAWGAREYAALVGEVLDELTGAGDVPGGVVVAGHSFGGRVAVCLAAARADLAGLVLTGVPLLRRQGTSRPALSFRVARALHRRRLVSDARMEALRQRYGSADYRAAQGVMRDSLVRLVGESYDDELRRVRCPTRLVWGSGDTAAPVAVAEEAAALLSAPHELVVVDGADHDLHRSHPDVLRRAIVEVGGAAS